VGRQQSSEQILALLDDWLETEFTFIQAESLAEDLATLNSREQPFVLGLIKRAAATNIQLAHRFALRSRQALQLMSPERIEAWVMHAADRYDRVGLAAALPVIEDPEDYLVSANEQANGAYLEDCRQLLQSFLQGVSGRRLQIAEDAVVWCDGETLYLPPVVASLAGREANFGLYKAMTAHLWAQTRFGTYRPDLAQAFAEYADPELAIRLFHYFERERLDACLERELPGLYRRMRLLVEGGAVATALAVEAKGLRQAGVSVTESLAAVARCYPLAPPEPLVYQGILRLDQVEAVKAARIEREKALIRVRLKEMLDSLEQEGRARREGEHFELAKPVDDQHPEEVAKSLLLDGKPLPPPDDVAAIMTSVILDFGELPPEYLYPAGDGEYDISQYRSQEAKAEDVWSGTYHEEGAFLYDEWDYRRQHHRKDWCVLRDHEVTTGEVDFYRDTLEKYRQVVAHLRRVFELLRGEDRRLKRQTDGEDVDIDALVDAWADSQSGLEMTNRLFTRMRREDRNIAVMLMVDLSGSTKGWINQAERESLVLLSEALEILGDRYAIYGFSGWGRKRCEVYRVKDFDEPLSHEVKGRIGGLEAKDYTRMGPAIRHLSSVLEAVEARQKLLITLSDGRPEDYDPEYRGDYAIEDTRMALLEAHRNGVHAYCITIDREGRDYLAHMYGVANFTQVEDVGQLPFKVSDIYRRLTT
jgi:nitric oxide reductase NorD protein